MRYYTRLPSYRQTQRKFREIPWPWAAKRGPGRARTVRDAAWPARRGAAQWVPAVGVTPGASVSKCQQRAFKKVEILQNRENKMTKAAFLKPKKKYFSKIRVKNVHFKYGKMNRICNQIP